MHPLPLENTPMTPAKCQYCHAVLRWEYRPNPLDPGDIITIGICPRCGDET